MHVNAGILVCHTVQHAAAKASGTFAKTGAFAQSEYLLLQILRTLLCAINYQLPSEYVTVRCDLQH